MTPEWTLGIDFGTSNTVAAYTGGISGAIEDVALTEQGKAMPSAVFVESPDAVMVGDSAIKRAETNPAGYLPSPKRVVSFGMVNVNGYDLPPDLLVASVLREVITRASRLHGGAPPTMLVLTHPEDWSPQEIQVLVNAADRVGFASTRVLTISESRAAAHLYASTHVLRPGAKIAVFDFGGGTVDVAILATTDRGTFDVVAARGENTLGGQTFDASIRRWVDQQLQDCNPHLLGVLRQAAPASDLRSLEASISRAKERLSDAQSASITVAAAGQRETFILTRKTFYQLIDTEIDRAVSLLRDTFGDAGVGGSDLAALYLTGGSSRIPLVRERLNEFGPIATLDDPKMVVVQGALTAFTDGVPQHHRPASQLAANHSTFCSSSEGPARGSIPSSRKRLIVAGAAVLAVAGGAAALSQVLPDDRPDKSTTARVVPADPEVDKQDIRDFTVRYLDVVSDSGPDEVNPLRCSSDQWTVTEDDPLPDPSRVLTLDEFVNLTITGKYSATARLGVTRTEAGIADSTDIVVINYAHEDGEWKVCGSLL